MDKAVIKTADNKSHIVSPGELVGPRRSLAAFSADHVNETATWNTA
jgi:hypothetical protein